MDFIVAIINHYNFTNKHIKSECWHILFFTSKLAEFILAIVAVMDLIQSSNIIKVVYDYINFQVGDYEQSRITK